MRYLVLIAVLAGTVLACHDTVAPGDPSLSSEASDGAHLDLRAERASLITAGNALSASIAPAMPLRFADLEVDTATRDVRRAGQPVALRPKEYELLLALMRRGGEVVTRRELLVAVWGYREDVTSRTVDTHVAVLRRKLGHAPHEPGYVVTVAKAGYRLRE